MDTKHEALELAEKIEQHGGATAYQAAAFLRRQHARIEELTEALHYIGYWDHRGDCVSERWDEMHGEGAWRALLTKKD